MKRLLFILFIAFISACDKNLEPESPQSTQESFINKSELESMLNTSLESAGEIIYRLSENDYILSIDTIYKDKGIVSKYVLRFAEDTVNVDIFLPDNNKVLNNDITFSLKKDSDSSFYWMFNNDWIKDAKGDKINVLDSNRVLKTKIQDDYWYYSYDDGTSWIKTNRATYQSFNYFFKDMSLDSEQLTLSLIDGMRIKIPLKKKHRLYYTKKLEELEGWTEGVFIEDGTWALSKPYRDGYLFTMSNVDSEDNKGIIMYYDTLGYVREIYADSTIIFLHNYAKDSVTVGVIDKENKISTKRIPFNHIIPIQPQTTITQLNSKYSDNSNQVGYVFSMFSNMLSGWNTVQEIAKEIKIVTNLLNFYKGTFDFTINLIGAFTGTDLLENYSEVGNILEALQIGIDIRTLNKYDKFKDLLKGGSIVGVIDIYLGLYLDYKSTFDGVSDALYGECSAEVIDIDIEDLSAKITIEITGFEKWRNYLQCGIAVGKSLLPDFKEDQEVKPITSNGIYVFDVSDLEIGVNYNCRPFIIDKNRTSLWCGWFIEQFDIPLQKIPFVKYGSKQSFKIPMPEASVLECYDITHNSAMVKCSYANTNKYTSCGLLVEHEDGLIDINAVNFDGNQSLQLLDLEPSTQYTCTAYVKVETPEGVETIEGNTVNFSTESTPAPEVEIMEVTSITSSSATVVISYKNFNEETKYNFYVLSRTNGLYFGAVYVKTLLLYGSGTESITVGDLYPGAPYDVELVKGNASIDENGFVTKMDGDFFQSFYGRGISNCCWDEVCTIKEIHYESGRWVDEVVRPDFLFPWRTSYECDCVMSCGRVITAKFYVEVNNFTGFVECSLFNQYWMPDLPLFWQQVVI